MLSSLSIVILLPLIEILTANLAKKNRYLHKLILLKIAVIEILIAINLDISKNIYVINFGFFSLKFMCDIYSYFFTILVIAMWILTIIYADSYSRIAINRKRLSSFFKNLSLSIFAVIGGAYSADLWTLLIFYILLIIFTSILIIQNPSKESIRAKNLYLKTHLLTSIFMLLPAIIILQSYTHNVNFDGGNISKIMDNKLVASSLLFLFIVGISKNCIFPFTRWITKSTVAANPVSALLHSVAGVKSGSIALIKIIVYIYGLDNIRELTSSFFTGGWVFYLCGITAVGAAYQALKSQDIKKRFAFSTISQLSYITSSLMIATPLSIIAAILHIISHSICKALLFYIAGIFSVVYKTRSTIAISRIAPFVKLWIFCIAILGSSIIGLPFLPGSYGKDYMIISEYQTHHYSSLIFLIIGSFINILYIYPIIKAGFFTKKIDQIETAIIPFGMKFAIGLGMIITISISFFMKEIIAFFNIYINLN